MRALSFVLLASALFTATALAAEFPSPEKLGETFIAHFNAGETDGLKTCAAESWWNGEYDNPRGLIKQGYGVKRMFNLALTNVVKAKDRAVVELFTVAANPGRRRTDLVFLYAENRGKSWLFYGMNEDKTFRAKFLEGAIAGDFHVKKLPPNKDLETLAAKITPSFSKVTEDMSAEDFSALFKDHFKVAGKPVRSLNLNLFQYLKKPSTFDSKWSETLKRAALIVSDPKTEQEPFPESMTLYFSKSDAGWVFTGAAAMLTSGSFLEF